MTGVNLSGAFLSGANLEGAHLNNPNLTDATLLARHGRMVENAVRGQSGCADNSGYCNIHISHIKQPISFKHRGFARLQWKSAGRAGGEMGGVCSKDEVASIVGSFYSCAGPFEGIICQYLTSFCPAWSL